MILYQQDEIDRYAPPDIAVPQVTPVWAIILDDQGATRACPVVGWVRTTNKFALCESVMIPACLTPLGLQMGGALRIQRFTTIEPTTESKW